MSVPTENNATQAGTVRWRRWLKMPPFLRGRLLVMLTLAYMAGLLLGCILPLPPLFFGGLTLILSLAALLLKKHNRIALVLLLAAMASLGCCLYTRAEIKAASFPVSMGEEAQIYGHVQADSVLVKDNRYRLQVRALTVNGHSWQGQIYVYYEGEPLPRGTAVAARGKVMGFMPYGNPGSFDYGAYMQRQGISTAISCYYGGELVCDTDLATVQGNMRGCLMAAFEAVAGESSGLLTGVFLGDKTDLTFAQKNALVFSGMMHAFSVSGLHVGYLIAAALLLAGAGRKRRWLRLALVSVMLLFYLNLTGIPAPILRATLMALCLLLATAVDEKTEPYTALCLAALLCLLYRPLWLMDAGFLLSFAAAFGLIYLLPHMRQLCGYRRGQNKALALLTDSMAVTFAASFATMPLISYYFYNISLVGWLISIPFVLGTGLAVICCFAASLLAIFSGLAATLPLYIADFIMRLLYSLSAWGSSLPWAYISSGHTPAWAVVVFYALLLLLPILAAKRCRPRLFLASSFSLLIVLLACSPLLTQALSRPNGQQLEVVFLDVGQGDAALIITPNGKTILVDGGGNRLSPGSVGENVLIPYLRYRGLRQIDLVVSSHPDEDHIDGLLTVLENMPVGQLLYADAFTESELQQSLIQQAQKNGAALTPAYTGQRFAVETGLMLEVYHPPQDAEYNERSSNDGSLTMLLTYGEVGFLFTGDVTFAQLASIPQAQVVKLPHHGSKNNYDEQAYAQLHAQAVILSVGRDNSYGHPAPSVIEYWQERAEVYRTDQQGAISVFSNGQSWQANTYW